MPLTQDQKTVFLTSVHDEGILRKEVLVPMFRNMRQFSAVVDTHGSDEKGKDIVLVGENAFGRKTYSAVIVKNEEITNASTQKGKEIVANVQAQIRMALTSGFDDPGEKRKVFFNEILIVTSRGFSNSAREAFVEVAKENRFTNIDFWDGYRIVTYLDKYLPEIYLVASGSLSIYFHTLKERCEAMTELKNIAIYSGRERKISDVFIEPTIFRKTERVANNKVGTDYETATFAQLIDRKQLLLVKGAAGAGKSTLMRSQVIRLIVDYELERTVRVPFLLRAKKLAESWIAEGGDPLVMISVNYVSRVATIRIPGSF